MPLLTGLKEPLRVPRTGPGPKAIGAFEQSMTVKPLGLPEASVMANWMESSEYPARLCPVRIVAASHELLPTG